jgi:small subunit ribosomal protein S20
MAHTRSARKRIRQSEKRRLRNASVRSRMKTYTKRAMAAIEAKDSESLKTLLPAALAEIDKAASKGVIHRNAAARKKSTLQRMANA